MGKCTRCAVKAAGTGAQLRASSTAPLRRAEPLFIAFHVNWLDSDVTGGHVDLEQNKILLAVPGCNFVLRFLGLGFSQSKAHCRYDGERNGGLGCVCSSLTHLF